MGIYYYSSLIAKLKLIINIVVLKKWFSKYLKQVIWKKNVKYEQ